jgi:hypothetical protein
LAAAGPARQKAVTNIRAMASIMRVFMIVTPISSDAAFAKPRGGDQAKASRSRPFRLDRSLQCLQTTISN